MSLWTVERLGRRGDGVVRGSDGASALAPLTLPGEVIEGEADDAGRIAAPRIVTASPHRVRPACPHYRTCGGCSLMHASDAFVAGWKADVVTRALAAHGIAAPPMPTPLTSPPRSRRRAVLAGRRTRKGALVGLHARASDVVVDLTDCLVLRPAITAALPVLRRLVMAGGSRSGTLSLAVTEGPEGLDVSVTGGKPADAGLMTELAALAEVGDLARLTWDGESLTRRAPWLAMGEARVVPPAGGFLQATTDGQAALTGAVLDATAGARRVLDLFAGCGTFTLPLAGQAEVHAVEGLAAPLAALDSAARATPGLRRVTTELRDLARRPLTGDALAGFDAIVIDPPRTGAEAQATALATAQLPVVAWISCDPVSFARDARLMIAGGWRLEALSLVDQFRWSAHIETSAVFRRSPARDT